MLDREWCVYRHIVPDGRMYIGIAVCPPDSRWSRGVGYKTNPEFWECIQTVGWDNIAHEIVATGLDKRNAMKLESELIAKYNTLAPHGFNRRLDDGRSYRKKLKEIGDRHGFLTVLYYWPDSDGYKVYRYRCICGNEFVCRGRDWHPNLTCGCKAPDNQEVS